MNILIQIQLSFQQNNLRCDLNDRSVVLKETNLSHNLELWIFKIRPEYISEPLKRHPSESNLTSTVLLYIDIYIRKSCLKAKHVQLNIWRGCVKFNFVFKQRVWWIKQRILNWILWKKKCERDKQRLSASLFAVRIQNNF